MSELTAGQHAGDRAAKNTVVRAGAEVAGKLASLAVFAALGRSAGEVGLGVYVFALGWVQIATMPIGLGMDRYFLRRVARDLSAARQVLDLLLLKLLVAVPVASLSLVLVTLLGYDGRTRAAVAILTLGLLLELLGRSLFSVFMAFERSELLAASLLAQRFSAAGLGLAALAAGFGVVTVAITYTVGAALGLATAMLLFRRRIGPLPRRAEPGAWRDLMRGSLPYGAQDLFGTLLSKLDVVLLSLLATQAAVGRYGAAYRMLEATFFLSTAVAGAFAAMYTYLDHDTQPTITSAFQRSIKLALVVLTPCAVVFAVLAEPLVTLVFGSDFEDSAEALRLLAPTVVLLGVFVLSSSLIVARRDPKIMAGIVAGAVGLNVVLNLILVPTYAERGAAVAMLITEIVVAPVALGVAGRAAGGVRWPALAAPLLAGAAMSAPVLLLDDELPLALISGGAVYVLFLVALERIISPADFRFARDLVKRRLPARLVA